MKTTTTHTPLPISENPIYTALQVAEEKMHMVYTATGAGKPKGLLLIGPAGIGKSQLGERVALEYGLPFTVEEPGSPVGLRQVLFDYRNEKSLQLDDTSDGLWANKLSLNLLKHALESKDIRIIPGYTVGAGKSFPPFEFHPAIVYTNTDPSTLKSRFKTDINAVLDRCEIVIIPNDPLMIFEYIGWLATEGGMLRSMIAQTPAGEVQMSQAAANEILEQLRTNAHRYPSLSPRALDMSARMRLESGAVKWRAHQTAKLLAEPRWQLPAKLYQYRVDWRRGASGLRLSETLLPVERTSTPVSEIVADINAKKAAAEGGVAEGAGD